MRPRHWLLLSVILYGVALALPALESVTTESKEEAVSGWVCFEMGLMFSFMVWPLIAWAPNAFLGTLWVRAWRGLPTKPLAWWSVAWSLGALVMIFAIMRSLPREGAGFWVASIATGVYAARQAGEQA